MKKLKQNFIFLFVVMSICSFSSCQLFEDLLKEPEGRLNQKDFVGLWNNDALETKIFENDILINIQNQSLEGNTFEMRHNGTYTTIGVSGTSLNGSWELVLKNNHYQILLDKGKDIERAYDVKKITKNKLVTNRKVVINNYRMEEYTFSYYR